MREAYQQLAKHINMNIHIFICISQSQHLHMVALVVKNLPANAGLIPGLGRLEEVLLCPNCPKLLSVFPFFSQAILIEHF